MDEQAEAKCLDDFIRRNAAWFYEHDGTVYRTKQRFNHRTREMEDWPIVTSEGEAFLNLVNVRHVWQQENEKGYDPKDQLEWALNELELRKWAR